MKRKVCESLFGHIGADCCCEDIPVTAFFDRDKSVCETGTDDSECTDRKSGTAVG